MVVSAISSEVALVVLYASRMTDTVARARTGLPLVFDAPVQCPAGRKIGLGRGGSSGCYCAIEHSQILAAENPSSLLAYCLPTVGHLSCPTWQAEKERIAEGRRTELVDQRVAPVEPGRVPVAGA